MIDPKAISQDLLDRSGRAYLSGDFDAFADCFALPHTVSTFESVRVIPDTAALLDVFHAMRRFFESRQVTDIVRPCILADFTDPDTIRATHETRLLAGSMLVQRPSVALSTIKRFGESWRVVDGQYAIPDSTAQVAALMAGSRMDDT